MNAQKAPILEINSDISILTDWKYKKGEYVRKGEIIASIESTKTVQDIESEYDGYIFPLKNAGEEFKNASDIIAYFFNSIEELNEFDKQFIKNGETNSLFNNKKLITRVTKKALLLAEKMNIDINLINKKNGLITESDIEMFIQNSSARVGLVREPIISNDDRKKKIVLIGAGGAAIQVLDIFSQYEGIYEPVAIVDDIENDWGKEFYGIPIIGGPESLRILKDKYSISLLIICITQIEARVRYYKLAKELGYNLENAIDKTCKISSTAKIGEGNIICAFSHIGAEAIIGNNNFISAYNSFDHHNRVGNNISTGPSCMMSGFVTIGNRVRFGTGIFVEPKIEIGDDVKIASGSIIRTSINNNCSVKIKGENYIIVNSKNIMQ